MAALIAYYLSELAPEDDRRDAIGTEDLRKYFRQANYPLPGAIQYTLGNAASAGFFESAGRGQYRLTAVGYNLVAHGLPSADDATVRARRPVRKATKKTPRVAPTKKVVKKAAARSSAARKGGAAKKRSG